MVYSIMCKKCNAVYSLRPEDLGELSRVEQMTCVKEGLDFSNMVKVTCTHCGTSSLVPRNHLNVSGEKPTGSAPRRNPFQSIIVETKSLGGRAFRDPGPLFNPARQQIIEAWLGNYAKNLEAAGTAFETGLDINGRPMSRPELAESVERMCREYSEGLDRLGEVCGHEVRQAFEGIIAGTRSVNSESMPAAPAGQTPARPTPEPGVKEAKPEEGGPAAATKPAGDPFKPVYDALIPLKLLGPLNRLFELGARSQKRQTKVSVVAVLAALVAAVWAGDKAGSFWLGLGVFFGLSILLLIPVFVIINARERATVAALANAEGLDVPDTCALFACCQTELGLFDDIRGRLASLKDSTFSDKLDTHLLEAISGAVIKVGLPEVLAPSRDFEKIRQKLDGYKEAVEAAKKAHTLNPIISKCKQIMDTADKIIENRKTLFALIDKLS